MDVVFPHGAGLDVHQKTGMACRVTPAPMGPQADGILEGRECGTLTRDVLALSDGLTEAGITPVAMESTGASWKPVDNLLEGTWPVCLVNAAPVTNGPGRQTDRAEARWLAKLRRYGGLQTSVMPPVAQRDRRDLTRDRTQVVQERTRASNRGPGVLERATIKRASVATDSRGVSGRAILAALLEGRTEPATLAELANGRWRRKIPGLEPARTGLVRDHHRRLVAMPGAPMDLRDAELEALSADSTRLLTELRAAPTPPSSTATAPPGAVASASA